MPSTLKLVKPAYVEQSFYSVVNMLQFEIGLRRQLLSFDVESTVIAKLIYSGRVSAEKFSQVMLLRHT